MMQKNRPQRQATKLPIGAGFIYCSDPFAQIANGGRASALQPFPAYLMAMAETVRAAK